MANLKEIRARITSVGSTMQITSAMKMVSAAKLRRAQDAIVRMRPYAEKINELLGGLSASLDVQENPYGVQRPVKKTLAVVITSNRGLCGAFNNNVIIETKRQMAQKPNDGWEVLPIGKKAFEAFKNSGILARNHFPVDTVSDIYGKLTFEEVSGIANQIMDSFTAGHYDRIVIYYNRFKNAATQVLMCEQMLPIQQPETVQAVQLDYLFVPGKEELISELIPKSLRIQLYKGILDSNAAEHGARMTAMHKATDNAQSLKKELTLSYNKARQAAITNEILEIVAGAEALNG
jgi:F-type H+-transporting ATPase subunit gamma